MRKKALLLMALLWVFGQTWADLPFRLHRYSSFTALETDPNSIVFIGNSITNMHEWWEAFGCNHNILNRGNSGAVSDETLENIEAIIAGHPKKVFLMIGTNDLGTSGINTPAHVATNVRQIAKRFRNESPTTELYLQSILPSSVGIRTLAGQKQANDSIRKICDEVGATYIDLWEVLGDYSNWTSMGISNDALHLSPKGFYLWCKMIAPYVGNDCVYTNGPNQYGGLSQSYAMRISAFGDLPVRSDDVLLIGDEMIHGGEWHELFHCDKIKDRGNAWGYGGRPISTTLISIPIILKGRTGNEEPAKVFLYAGVADVNSSNDISATFTEYKKLVDKTRELAPNTHIFLMAHLPQTNASTNTNKVVPFNNLQKQLAEEMENVTYIDTYTPFVKNGVSNGDYMSQNYLMGRGYNLMARVMAEYLQEEGVKVLSEEESDSLMAVYAQRNALGKVISSLEQISVGNSVGQYPAAAYAAVAEKIDAANQLLKENATAEDMKTMANTLTEAYQLLLESIVLPKTSTADEENWYTICSTLRDSRYMRAAQATGGIDGGENTGGTEMMWKFVERSDGKGWDIVNRKYGTYISPSVSNNAQVSTVSSRPSKGWTLSYASTAGMFIISSDKVELNQTQSSLSYKIYNWSSGYTGTDRTDTGCQFTIAVAPEPEPEAELPAPVYQLDRTLTFDGTSPFRLSDSDASKLLSLEALTIYVDYTESSNSSNFSFFGSSAEGGDDFFCLFGLREGRNAVGICYTSVTTGATGWFTANFNKDANRHKAIIQLDQSALRYVLFLDGSQKMSQKNDNVFGSGKQWEYRRLGNVPGVSAVFIGGLSIKGKSNHLPYHGTIHDVRVWDEVLTAAQIALIKEEDHDESIVVGIDEIEGTKGTDDRLYDLMGRPVRHPKQGIYLSNGRKFVK